MNRYAITRTNIESDKKEIIRVLETSLSMGFNDRYEWIYKNNPAGQAHCWVAKDQSIGKIVGCACLFPREIYLDGKLCIAGIAGDFAVDPEHRVFGPALQLQKKLIEDMQAVGVDLIFAFPNKQSEAVHLRAGYKTLAPLTRMTRILRSKDLLSKRFSPRFSKFIAPLVDAGIRIVFANPRKTKGCSFQVIPVERFDWQYSAEWERFNPSRRILCKRSPAFLNWRYADHPRTPYKMSILSDGKKGSAAGYLTYYVSNHVCWIADVFSIKPTYYYTLIENLINSMGKQDVDTVSISYLNNGLLRKTLQSLGFISRKEDGNFLIYSNRNDLDQEILFNVENWHIFKGDSDI